MLFLIRRTLYLFLAFEMSLFFIMYCFGPKSIKTLFDIAQQKKDIVISIKQLKQENKQLEQQIEYYSTDFAQEKIAREVLLMKRDNETVYFVS